jgi:hypothetical protein
MKTRIFLPSAVVLVANCFSAGIAQAQTIQISRETFVDTPALPFARPPELKRADARAATPAATPAAIAPAASIELEKGKRVDDQLRSYGKRSGWDLVWQAPDYVLDKNMVIEGDFESAVLFFLKGANEAGTRLRAVFYRGNKTVRVMEF